MGTLFVDKLDPQSGTSLEIGSSGDTITIPSGATITNNGTQTGFGEANTPAFLATLSADTSITDDVITLIPANNEVFDTDSAYNNGTYKFTPQTAGKYLVFVYAQCNASGAGQSGQFTSYIYKNGSAYCESELSMADNAASRLSATAISIVDMNGSSDYIQGYVVNNVISGSTTLKSDSNKKTRFGAFRIIT
jgi:hypothetical protein